ncbi:MAG: glycerol kinase GlpK [Spirochaetaceae bacterium]|nr:glycerol kinase GlpK [Spirochaetaceae bacterium]
MKYILSIDQSTSGTKAMLFDEKGSLIARADTPHEQIITKEGWVSHDGEEIYRNTLASVQKVIEKAEAEKAVVSTGSTTVANSIIACGISNQRETAIAWDKTTGKPINHAVVWQCNRGQAICDEIIAQNKEAEKIVQEKTGLPFSPYFSAAKIAWLLRNSGVSKYLDKDLHAGTIDSWLLFKLSGGKVFATDFSNASRTQLLNINTLQWDDELCALFGVNKNMLPDVRASNSLFAETDFEGTLPKPIPIHAMMGDSHAAFYAQGCHTKGLIKATYGTGSSVMLNIGDKPLSSKQGLATSIGYAIDDTVNYVLEGNINYTGSVIKWLVDDLHLLSSSKEARTLAASANQNDGTILVPAFSGLGAPYWNSEARAIFCGMGRSTGRAELVKAGEESIAYQITDIINIMREDAACIIEEIRVDGGPTNDAYLMQFQSDIADCRISVPSIEELSGAGAAFMAGISAGLYSKTVFDAFKRKIWKPEMDKAKREAKLKAWQDAVRRCL